MVSYPHERQVNAGKVSNSAKPNVMDNFLKFVDLNSQPNVRSADSHGPTHYFLSKFATIQTPKKDVANYSERVQRSVVGEFCRTQREGNPGCSNGSAYNWLHTHRPQLAVCPQKQEYYNSCAKFSTQIHAKRTTLNHIRQSGSASIEQQQDLEKEVKELESQHEDHRKKELSHEDYIQVRK